jgi:hypothetical protein
LEVVGMSWHKMIELRCDGCGEPGDDWDVTVAIARRRARSDGWHLTGDGRDLCEGCWETGVR